MKEESSSEGRSLVMPFLLGAAVGAGLALLLAPKSGKELRSDIQDMAVSAKDQVNSAVEKTRDFYDEKKSALVSAIDAGKEAYVQERDKQETAAA